jgi:DNA-directed RNA polymerase subunit E'
MYMITEVERTVPIPPKKLSSNIEDVIEEITEKMFEGSLGEDKALTVLVRDVQPVGQGRIVHGGECVYQTVRFNQLVFKPKENEIIQGVVVGVHKYGAFVRFGPLDGLLHISQVMDARVNVDEANQRLVEEGENGRSLSLGDVVRARVISIDLNEKNPQESKIGLTMRQPGLGKLQWLEEDSRRPRDGGEA